MQSSHNTTDRITGWWKPEGSLPETGPRAVHNAILRLRHPVYLLRQGDEPAVAQSGTVIMGRERPLGEDVQPLCAYCPPLYPEDLGDPLFRKNFGLRFSYVADAMANGITSVEMTEAAGRAGMLGFFGAAGLSAGAIEKAIHHLQNRMKGIPFGFNLIHSPNDPDHEAATVDLYLKNHVRIVSASAYLGLTLPVVYYRVRGIHRDPQGNIVCPGKLVAKVSREEVAEKFLSPPPEKLLRQLVEKRMITEQEAELAKSVPMAEHLTAEADSGGHTDNRPALTLFPTMLALRDRLARKYNYSGIPCVGLGGGIATPESAAAAFAMGADYLVTGSVNQACTEAGTSEAVRQMLAEARQADVIMAPAADMFEMGVKVQVLKRGTMFPLRAAKLHDLYNRYDCYEDIPQAQRQILERDFFQCSFETAWAGTREFFERRDPRQNVRAEKDPKHKMALVFRSYLGQSSRWAISGDPGRRMDYQIWCGPAIGAFNEWTKGSFLEKPENRQTVTVAMNLLTGAAVVTRAGWLRSQGIVLPPDAGKFSPMPMSKIKELTEME
ncbi:MAG: PfaD family polyunsaturated fatty acid/polyketide biosynthesis protein [Desulfococcaceae bacterium]